MKHNYKGNYGNIMVRPLEPDDIESLRQWRNNPENTRYLTPIPFITAAMQKSWYERYQSNIDEFQFAICFKDSNELIGSGAIYNFLNVEDKKLKNAKLQDDSTDNSAAAGILGDEILREAEFGKFMIGAPDAHGRHAGVSAVKAFTDIAFNVIGIDKLVLHVFCENVAALKVYQQAGFEIKDKHLTDNGVEEYLMVIEKNDNKRIL